MDADSAPKPLLPFEAPLKELDEQIENLRASGRDSDLEAAEQLAQEREDLRRRLYENLTPWDRVCLARHPERPGADDYLEGLCEEWFELRGDRCAGDDPAVLAAVARLDGRRIVVVATRRGRGADSVGFGMPMPEGYRKARRAMQLAEKLRLPLVSLIDTPGASPTVEAEDRGQAFAIASALAAMSELRAPTLAVVIGEGGSAGALALAVADWMGMLENAYFSVVSPEGAAALLWKDMEQAPQAARALRLTARELVDLGLADEVIPEPLGAAHLDPAAAVQAVRAALLRQLDRLAREPLDALLARRYARYRRIGVKPPAAS